MNSGGSDGPREEIGRLLDAQQRDNQRVIAACHLAMNQLASDGRTTLVAQLNRMILGHEDDWVKEVMEEIHGRYSEDQLEAFEKYLHAEPIGGAS